MAVAPPNPTRNSNRKSTLESTQKSTRSRRFPVKTLLREAVRPISDRDGWNRLLQGLQPLWTLDQARARIVARVEESDDTFSLWLRANRHWHGYRPGQHAALGVEIDGVRRQRVFSLSHADHGNRTLRMTIRRQPGEGMTDWLYRHAAVGRTVDLSAAGGEFVLPEPTPRKLLMIAAGSGITPMMAMLHDLAARGFDGDIVLLQMCRNATQQLFANELVGLEPRLPGLSTLLHASAVSGRLAAAGLPELVPDLAQRHTLLCGPAAFMHDVEQVWAGLGCSERLQREHFAPPRPVSTDPSSPGTEHRVLALESAQAFTQGNDLTLLESAEAAGDVWPWIGSDSGGGGGCGTLSAAALFAGFAAASSTGRVRRLHADVVSTTVGICLR